VPSELVKIVYAVPAFAGEALLLVTGPGGDPIGAGGDHTGDAGGWVAGTLVRARVALAFGVEPARPDESRPAVEGGAVERADADGDAAILMPDDGEGRGGVGATDKVAAARGVDEPRTAPAECDDDVSHATHVSMSDAPRATSAVTEFGAECRNSRKNCLNNEVMPATSARLNRSVRRRYGKVLICANRGRFGVSKMGS